MKLRSFKEPECKALNTRLRASLMAVRNSVIFKNRVVCTRNWKQHFCVQASNILSLFVSKMAVSMNSCPLSWAFVRKYKSYCLTIHMVSINQVKCWSFWEIHVLGQAMSTARASSHCMKCIEICTWPNFGQDSFIQTSGSVKKTHIVLVVL